LKAAAATTTTTTTTAFGEVWMRRGLHRLFLLIALPVGLLCFLAYQLLLDSGGSCMQSVVPSTLKIVDSISSSTSQIERSSTFGNFSYDNTLPLIFIGGFPRSGTTLIRAMLDAHPDIRCGEETRLLPRILGMRAHWKNEKVEWRRLIEAGVDDEVIDAAVSAFIMEVIVRHGPLAPRLCDKDPFLMKFAVYLSELFPNAKFVFMIRDGRAAVHSMITRRVTIGGFDLTDIRQCLSKWSLSVAQMYNECYNIGARRCFPMYYEQLVLNPEKWLRELLAFLEVPWSDHVLNHEKYIGREISLSKSERSTDQVMKPVYTSSLDSWVGKFPEDILKDMPKIAPMLDFLGSIFPFTIFSSYDPKVYKPDYGKAGEFITRKLNLFNGTDSFKQWLKKVIDGMKPAAVKS
ncbi:Protein-tyrosine sulfotransferase A, partial [Trichinella sp. T6]